MKYKQTRMEIHLCSEEVLRYNKMGEQLILIYASKFFAKNTQQEELALQILVN